MSNLNNFIMIANLIFGIFLLCFIIALFRDTIIALIGRLWEAAITAFICAFFAWLLEFVLPVEGLYWIGAGVGIVYCVFCWIFSKRNKLVHIWFNH